MVQRLIMMAMLLASVCPAAVIRLPASARCADSVVTLGSIAEIVEADGVERAELAKVALAPAPLDGETRWIDIAEIKDRLDAAGFRLIDLEFSGSRRVEVRSAKAEPIRKMNRTPSQWREELERVVRESLGAGNSPFATQSMVRVRVEGDRAITHLTNMSPTDWELVAPRVWQAGWQMAELLVREANGPITFPIRIEILANPEVVAARVPIAKGVVVKADDLILVSHESVTSAEGLLEDPKLVVGREAVRNLPAGEPILDRDLRLTPVVFRGQPITVRIIYRSAWLEKTFLAGRDAGIGEWIDVYESNGQGRAHELQARVTGAHEALLPENAPASSAKRLEPAKKTASRPARPRR